MSGDRRAALEAAIDANPADERAYVVYADYLQEIGDPRGELIALQLAESCLGVDVRAEQLIRENGLGLGPHATVDWRWGFVRSMWLDPTTATGSELQAVFDHPSARFLETLEVRHSEHGLQTVIDALGRRIHPCLTDLVLGGAREPDDGTARDRGSFDIGGLEPLWSALPHLTVLHVTGQNFSFGRIEAPRMWELFVSSIALRADALRSIADARWPELVVLSLGFGHSNPTLPELEHLLAGAFPVLESLHLHGNFVDELVEPLAAMPLLRRLRKIWLSGGMTDRGGAAIVRHADAFAHLETLALSRNYLSPSAVVQLQTVAKVVMTDEQQEPPDRDLDLYDY